MAHFSFDRLRNRIASIIASGSNPYLEAFIKQVGGGGFTQLDIKGPTYLDEGFAKNPDVYAIVKQMADKTSSVPWTVKRVSDEKSRQRANNLLKSTQDPRLFIKRQLLITKAFEEKELPFPMERPNPYKLGRKLKLCIPSS